MIIDTGPLVAALDADDRHHDACVRLLATARRPLRIPGPVLTEVCYLIEREQGPTAEAMFLTSLADEEFELIHPTTVDLRRMAELVTTYHDLPLGAVDASVLALAERTGDYDIATLDRRHFTIVRPAGNRILNLYP
ncbi:type II toxin-antitoxin system VapC family toxin [uncultured Pseudonocardia sp.]|jgi:predicted nucleic acid-binding protein|uniref:type II toxin-antitoxin system VapC family toxin n=1 Tax=uncultured Pseudonocardia sp. TaxID=211455 RepID=UPI00261BD5F1|nr:PIN domain-containing protein [uncultured Pseudonocardia sp.]